MKAQVPAYPFAIEKVMATSQAVASDEQGGRPGIGSAAPFHLLRIR